MITLEQKEELKKKVLEEHKKKKEDEVFSLNKDYEELKKQLQENHHEYNEAFIKKQFAEKANLPQIYITLMKHEPALIHEIYQEVLLTKQTCYSLLFNLIKLGLVDRIYVSKLNNPKEGIETDALKKFDDWASTMPPNLKRYYYGKTSLWYITENGKKFARWAREKELEFKQLKRDEPKEQ